VEIIFILVLVFVIFENTPDTRKKGKKGVPDIPGYTPSMFNCLRVGGGVVLPTHILPWSPCLYLFRDIDMLISIP